MIDSLGDRMKKYEICSQTKLMNRAYTIIRLDGRSFHTYTKGLNRPFDADLIEDMNATAAYLCKNIMGVKLAYVQSDEITLLLTDFDELTTQAWFDNNVQKMVSVASSVATSYFNKMRLLRAFSANFSISFNEIEKFKLAEFDARVFQVPTKDEVINNFIWRQKDAMRNSISSVAQSLYSAKELNGKNSSDKLQMISDKGINYNNYTFREKHGGVIAKTSYYIDKLTLKTYNTVFANYYIPENTEFLPKVPADAIIRTQWELVKTPIFTENRSFLNELIPENK